MADRVLDPVCGMSIDPARAAATVRHGGAAYHFCSEGCARRFQATPSRFVGGAPAHSRPAPAPSNLVRGSAGRKARPAHAGPAAREEGAATGASGASVASMAPGPVGWKAYLPLAIVLALLLAAVVVLAWGDPSTGVFLLRDSLVRFMAGFFLVFAGFKLLDLRGFAEGYATYDLLAQKVPAYGYVYPFIELAFGLVMLGGYHDAWLLWAEIAVMAFSGAGVAVKLARKEAFTCACLGTFLKVPLTKVALVEDFGMAALAFILLFL
jgi:YHS domain-containing protein